MDEVQEAAVVEAALDSLGTSATAEQILQAIHGYSESAIQIALRRLGGGGGGSVVSCVIARDANGPDIHDAGDHPIIWDALYDNYQDFGVLTSIPAGLGLTFAFNGTSANITTTAAGVWAFTYNFTKPGDVTWVGVFDTRFGQQDIMPGNAGVSTLIAQTLSLPSGVTFAPRFTTLTEATTDPLDISGGVYLIATRLA